MVVEKTGCIVLEVGCARQAILDAHRLFGLAVDNSVIENDNLLVASCIKAWVEGNALAVFRKYKESEKVAIRKGLQPLKTEIEKFKLKGIKIEGLPEPLATKFSNGLQLK